MSEALGIGIPEIDKHIRALKKADVLRPIGRSVYAVNPFIVGQGKWSDIKELRSQFDYNSGLITTQSIIADKITGKTMAKITQEVKKNQKKIPGQMKLFDKQDKITMETERYRLEQIKQLFDYDIILIDYPDLQQDIDSVMNVLHTAMNTSKATIRIAGEDKPAMTVIGKLMKLNKESIMYAIEKFSEQTGRIKNPTAYMLTVLYNAPEQYHLDIKNQVSHDTAKANHSQKDEKAADKIPKPQNGFANCEQREYDFDEIKRSILKKQQESESIEPDIAEMLKISRKC